MIKPLFVALCLLITPTLAFAEDTDWEKIENLAPSALKLKDLDGKLHNLADYKGRTVIVNFWATWCPPCVAEMPSLSKLNASLDPKKTVILTINSEADSAKVKKFLRAKNLSLTVLHDADEIAEDQWDIHSIPTSFIIGPDQKIKFGADNEVDFMSKELKDILAKLNAGK